MPMFRAVIVISTLVPLVASVSPVIAGNCGAWRSEWVDVSQKVGRGYRVADRRSLDVDRILLCDESATIFFHARHNSRRISMAVEFTNVDHASLKSLLGHKYKKNVEIHFQRERAAPRLHLTPHEPAKLEWKRRDIRLDSRHLKVYAHDTSVSPWVLFLLLFPG